MIGKGIYVLAICFAMSLADYSEICRNVEFEPAAVTLSLRYDYPDYYDYSDEEERDDCARDCTNRGCAIYRYDECTSECFIYHFVPRPLDCGTADEQLFKCDNPLTEGYSYESDSVTVSCYCSDWLTYANPWTGKFEANVLYSQSDMTDDKCYSACLASGYGYSAVNSDDCFCSKEPPSDDFMATPVPTLGDKPSCAEGDLAVAAIAFQASYADNKENACVMNPIEFPLPALEGTVQTGNISANSVEQCERECRASHTDLRCQFYHFDQEQRLCHLLMVLDRSWYGESSLFTCPIDGGSAYKSGDRCFTSLDCPDRFTFDCDDSNRCVPVPPEEKCQRLIPLEPEMHLEEACALSNGIVDMMTVSTECVCGLVSSDPGLLTRSFNTDHKPLLHYAAQNGRFGVVQCLLDAGADVDLRTKSGRSALGYAVYGGVIRHSEPVCMVDMLIKAGASIHDGFPALPLGTAASGGFLVTARMLLELGADANGVGMNGFTPVMYAAGSAKRKADQIVRLLIRYGADVTVTNDHGDTALHRAAFAGDAKVVATLIAFGADVNAVNLRSETPLIMNYQKDNIDVAKVLLAAGADPDQQDQNGKTALIRTVEWPQSSIIGLAKVLVENGADLNLVDNNGNTALDYVEAKSWAPEELRQMLIDAGAQNAGR